jgi:maleylpyruvate isomerase
VKLRLHNYWRSSCSHRVRIALGLKGLAYEYVAVNLLKRQHHADGYVAKNAMAQVPTLELIEDDGTVWLLTQSMAIMEYLDERWQDPPIVPPALPAAPLDGGRAFLRMRCRALAEIINSGVQPFQNPPTLNAVKALGGDSREWAATFISTGLAAFERLMIETWRTLGSPPGNFCSGDVPTIADCCLVPQLASARRFGVDLAPHPLLLEIEQRCLALPAFADAAPERQPDAVTT